jgi:cytochrome P450
VSAPRGAWLLGHLPAIRSDPLELLDACQPPVAKLRLGRPAWLLLEPADIRHVLHDEGDNYSKGQAFRFGRRLYGNSLLVSEGDGHRRQARQIGGLFFEFAARSFIEPAAKIADQLAQRWRGGDSIDLWSAANDLTLAISSQAVLGDDWLPPWLSGGRPESLAIHQAFDTAMAHVARQNFSLLPLPDWLPLPPVRRYRRAIETLDAAFHESVARRLAGTASGGFLEHLLKHRNDQGEPLSQSQVRDQALVMMLGGYESSATALCWMLLLVGRHAEVRQRLKNESQRVLGDRLPTSGDLPKLPYASQVVSESLRLYPPPWLIPRTAIREDQLPSGCRIPPGGQVFLSPYRTQRDPRFFDDPLTLRPERFAAPAAWPDGAYFPFGLGPRHCLGESVARAQLSLILTTLGRRFVFQSEGELPRPKPLLTLRPPTPLFMRVESMGAILLAKT